VFLAIGFETTVASIAGAMKATLAQGLQNLTFYCSFRMVPPALRALLSDPELALDGFILPGHVSVIIGSGAYGLLEERGVPGAVAGFEPVDILRSVDALVQDVNAGRGVVRNLYPQVVRQAGNPAALRLFDELFETTEAAWRGIGTIPDSGLALREEFSRLDAQRRYGLAPVTAASNPGCRCGEVLRGVILPAACALFGEQCTPDHPVGPCMVSSEGSCSAYYKYGGRQS
jgi:hydrogenase expression/formation protein HypD